MAEREREREREEGCNSRSLSLLLKPCIPSSSDDPRRHFTTPSPLPRPASISALPDDLLLEILSRAPSLPSLPLVCRRFRSLINSGSFACLRRRRGLVTESLLAVSVSSDLSSLYCAKLCFNSGEEAPTFQTSTFPFSSLPSGSFSHAQAASIGRFVYLIGRGATLRFDAWTGSVAVRAATLFPRKKFALAAINGRIYIAGGSSRTSAIEEYDPDSDTWRIITNAPFKRYGCVGAAGNGIFYIAGGLKISNSQNTLSAHACAGSVDQYCIASNAWVRTDRVHGPSTLPGGGCIVAICAIKDDLFILASHAGPEISFWRRNGGKWERLEKPPVERGLVRVRVRVSCEAVAERKVVALVEVRERGRERGEVAVLVYDVLGAKWSCGPGLPRTVSHTCCVCVEC
ncbi:hypothetical protein LUZ60_017288 [Juncus effusus]|nr:hypothetical protein LUZ60_017288 [Juncus effusus]